MDEKIATLSALYDDYPVTVNSKDFSDYVGLDLFMEIHGELENRVTFFLDTVHRQIYDFLIYNVGERDIKDRLINEYKQDLEKSLKKALLLQGQYLLQNDNIELFNGVIKTANGLEFKEVAETVTRVIAPSVINILESTKPNILFAGE